MSGSEKDMSFKFFQSMGFLGQPSVSQFRSAFNLFSVYPASGAFVNTTSLTIDTTRINQLVDACIDGGYDAIAWNETGSNLEIARAGMTDVEIDAILDAIKSVYDQSKARANARGRSDLFVGFDDIPGGFSSSYSTPLQYEQNSSNPTYLQNFQSWTDWMDRLNKRKINGVFVTTPFSASFDFICPKVNGVSGTSSTAVSEWKLFARRTLQEMRSRVAGGKPLYASFASTYDASSYYIGVPISSNHMTEAISLFKTYSDGIVLKGGLGSSYKYGNFRWRPSGANEAADLTAWRTISSGSFSLSIAGVKYKITGINTSAAVSMTAVASTLQSAIQSKISAGLAGTFDGVYPLPLGTVTVTWNSTQKSFLFSMTTNGATTPQPPYFHRNYQGSAFVISSKNDWNSSTAGTDLAVSQFIGDITINNASAPANKQWVYTNSSSQREWEEYAEGQSWWTVFSEQSLLIADIKDFKFFYWSAFSGQPNVTTFRNTYGVEFMNVGGFHPFTITSYDPSVLVPILSTGILTVNDSAINSLISAYLDPSLGDNQSKYYCYDLDLYISFMDNTQYSDTVIDNMLESYIAAYNRTKELLAARGITDVKIGFYLTPSFKSYYDPVMYHHTKGNDSIELADYDAWQNKYRRINLRKSGSDYVTKKFSDSADFVTCEVYPFYGENDIYDDVYFKENILQAVRYVAGNKPLYVFVESAFHSSTPWSGKVVSGNYMRKTVSWVKKIADGCILWTAYNPSYRNARQRHFMTASGGPPSVPAKSLSDWQTITNGCFSYSAGGLSHSITGVDFSSATSIGGIESTSVANIIEKAINDDLYYLNTFYYGSTATTTPGLIFSVPYQLGSVVVNYESDTSNNSPNSYTRVPCFEISYTDPSLVCPPDFNSYNGREFIYCFTYTDSASLPVGATDIGVADWIGTYTYTDQEHDSNYYSGADFNSDEFNNGWAINTNWFHAYSSMALSHKYSKERSLYITETIGNWSGKPTFTEMKAINNIDRAYTAYTGSGWAQFTDNYIAAHISQCLSQDCTLFVWDVEGDYCNVTTITVWPLGVSEAQADANLERFKSLYNRTKAQLAALGRTDIRVGYYGAPFAANTYYGALYWADPVTYAAHATAGAQFANSLVRTNQRYSNGTYVTTPFEDYNDFYAPSYYPLYGGWSVADIVEADAIKGSMTKIIEVYGHSRPIYPFLLPTFFEAGALNPLTGMAQKGTLAQRLNRQCFESEADGAIMWYATRASTRYTNHRFTPTVAKTISQWQAVTNGCFILSVDCFPVMVTGLNFSTIASMNDVCSVIQNGINTKIATITINPSSYSVWWTSSPVAPRNIGDITVTWDNSVSKFIINSSRGTTKIPSGHNFPPDFEKSYFVIKPWSSWGSSQGALPGTDLGTAEWIGNHSLWTDATITITDNATEYERWAEGSEWWNSYKSFAYGAFGTNLSNRVVPHIEISATSGEAPFTIHVNATASWFNGIDPQDCIFEWDFGDSNIASDIANRTYISDHRINNDCDANGSPHRATSLSNKQRGINAAYTYYHNNNGIPFTITLKVWHNGVASDTIVKKITILNPTINNYPINVVNQWTKVQIMPNNLDPSGTAYPNAFQTLASAISWMDINKTEGKVVFEFLSGAIFGLVNFPISDKVTITKSNVILKGLNQNLAYIEADDVFLRPSATSLVEISPAASNVYFMDIAFGKTSESPSTSNLIGCTIKPPAQASTSFRNITFTKCSFVSLHQAVRSEHFVNGLYFNQCLSQQTKIKTFDLMGQSVVMNACSHSKINTTQVIGTHNQTDCIVHFGSSSGIAECLSMNFCDFRYNGELGSNSSAGSIYLQNARYVSIYGSILHSGSNYVDDCFVVRFDSNIINIGGYDYGLIVKAPVTDITFASNRFNIDNLGINCGVLRFAGINGLINNIKILNNNVVAKSNIIYTNAIWNLTAPTGTAISDSVFVNNLNAENAGICMSRWLSVDSTISTQFSDFSHNIWPLRIDSMDFAYIGGSLKTWDQWVIAAVDSNSQQVDVIVEDLISMYGNKLLIGTYPQIQSNSYFHPAVSKDFNDEARNTSTYYGVGAARPLVLFTPSTSSFTVSSSTVSRTRVAEAGWTPPASQNTFISVTDPVTQTFDNNFQLVPKPVQKKININARNLVDFAPQESNTSHCRALRAKIDLNQNPTYKNVSFGVINVSGNNRYRGTFTLQNDTVQDLIDFPLSSYATVAALASAVQSYGRNTLGLAGFDVQAFGSLPTSNLVAGSLSVGVNRWAVSYYDLTVNYGNYINSTYSVTNRADGYDVTITYSNDGPSGQSDGDPRQRLGSVYIDGLLVGSKFAYIYNLHDSSSREIDTNFSLFFGTGFSYPFDKFSPTINLVGSTYAIGVSVKYDQIATHKSLIEITGAWNNCVSNRWKWGAESQSDDLSIANADCLASGQTYQATFSVRFTRDPRKWVYTLEPYKTYFAQNFGSVKFMKDPRPIKPFVPAIVGNGQPFGYHNYEDTANQSPAIHGWAWWANKIRYNHNSLGYERQLMWATSGLYANLNAYNYPFFMISPLMDEDSEFPHSFVGPHSDSCYNYVGSCIPGTFTINPQLLQDTFYMIRDIIQEVPVFGFYQGYGSIVHKRWNPDYKDISKASTYLYQGDPKAMDMALDEWSLINHYAKANFLGIDAYSVGLDSQNHLSKFLTFLDTQFESTRLLTEISPDDIACTHSSGYIMSGNGVATLPTGPNYIADYILPGNENVVFVYMNEYRTHFPYGIYNHWYIKNRMAAHARWGYVVAHVDLDGDINTNTVYPITSSIYQAADRRFVYDAKPASYGPLSSPTNITHAVTDRNISLKYPDLKKQTITLSWNGNTEPDFSHYLVYRAAIVNGQVDLSRPYQLKSYLKAPLFNDNQVFPGETYYYKIVAVDVDGNTSTPTPYQVTFIADSPILNPPTNVSATSSVVEGKIVVAWGEPSSSYLPSPSLKSPPRIILQTGGGWTATDFAHPVFDLANVYPLINDSISYGDTDSRTMVQRATAAADAITTYRNYWVASRPNTPFRYAYWPQNYGAYGWGSSTTNPFAHISDRLSNGNSCLWTVNGRAEAKSRMQTFFVSLSSTLRSRGIPDPVYVDPDYENGATIAGGDFNNRTQWHGWLAADSRYSTTTFDGVQTYAQWVAGLTDLDGTPIPSSQLYPHIYGSDTTSLKRAFLSQTISSMVVDYVLWDTLAIPAKEVWPNVVVGNYNTFCANRQNLVHGYRFKESPVDMNTNFHLDVQIPVNYGWYPTDGNAFAVGNGYNSYAESVYRYGVNTDAIKDPNALIRAINVANTEYFCKGCQAANPNKPISFWMSYIDCPVIYDNIFERSNIKFPTGFRSNLLYDKEHVMNMFRIYNKYNVTQVGFFLGQTYGLAGDQRNKLFDKLYSVLSSLQEAGYVV